MTDTRTYFVMPGLVPGIHAFIAICEKDVDGRDKPGHDGGEYLLQNTQQSSAVVGDYNVTCNGPP